MSFQFNSSQNLRKSSGQACSGVTREPNHGRVPDEGLSEQPALTACTTIGLK